MKTSLLRSLLALSALCVTAHLAAAEIPVSSVPSRVSINGAVVSPGMSRLLVGLSLGNPNVALPDGTWLFHGYTTQTTDGRTGRNGTLVVRFEGNLVRSLHIADASTVLALRSAPTPRATRFLAAASSSR